MLTAPRRACHEREFDVAELLQALEALAGRSDEASGASASVYLHDVYLDIGCDIEASEARDRRRERN